MARTPDHHVQLHRTAEGGRVGAQGLCWNCHLEEHAHRQCPYARRDFCQDCGQPGVTGPRCPRCESRRGPGARGPNVPQTQGQTPLLGLGPGGPLPQEDTRQIIHWSRLLPRQLTSGPDRRRRNGNPLEPLPGGSILVEVGWSEW